MASASYALEHFYYGQLVKEGKPTGELKLLAASAGAKPEFIMEAVQQALIPPLASSWGLVRGKNVPFIFVQSQLGGARQPVLHFVFVPPDVLKVMSGNLKVMRTLLTPETPTFETTENILPRVALPQAGPPSAEAQVDSMLALMGFTHDRLNVIESLLAALIQGVPIIIQGAPDNLDQRTAFVEGLLALLPPPARFGVTFATHSLPSTRVDAQIRFLSDETAPDGALIYKWGQPTVAGKKVEDDYSHFIISQLRLDIDSVLKQTEALTQVAAWRIKRGDTLAEALRYGSHRLKIDDALVNNQPIELEDVSKILAEDPTLSESVRAAYIRHLMALSLALGDTQRMDTVSVMIRQNAEVESEVISQLSNALTDGKTDVVYQTVSRWLTNPLGPRSKPWLLLYHRAALAHLEAMVKAKDVAGTNAFLQQLTRSAPTLEAERIIHKVIDTALPLAAQDTPLAQTILLLAAGELQVDDFQTILRERPFAQRLPKRLARLIPFLNGEEPGPSPAGLLAEGASELGEQGQSLALIRMAEVALLADRRDLLDTPALAGLAYAASTAYGAQYDQVLRWLVKSLSDDETLASLDDPGPRYLLQILLARRAYQDLINELAHHQRVLFPKDSEANYSVMVRRLFAETAVPVTDIPGALATLKDGGLKPQPLAMAYLGVLQRHQWPVALEQLAVELTNLLFNNRSVLEVVNPDTLIELLEFHAKRRDTNNAIRVAGLLPGVAIRRPDTGLPSLIRMYQALTWDDKVRAAGLEVLRRFIRRAEDTIARLAMIRFTKELGEPVGKALEASYIFRRLLDGDDISEFASNLHTAAELLYDTTISYVDKNRAPTLRSLINDLNSLFGNLNEEERKAIANSILGVGRATVLLGRHYRQMLPRSANDHIDALLQSKAAPRNAMEVFFVMGGYFARGRRLDPKLESPTANHPLMDRSAPSVMRDAATTDRLLRNVLKAFPLQATITMSAEAIHGEIESLWGDISLYERRELVRDLAIDLQRIPVLLGYISEHGDVKAMEDKSGLGKKIDTFKYRPESTLEFYRLIYGYFRSQLKL